MDRPFGRAPTRNLSGGPDHAEVPVQNLVHAFALLEGDVPSPGYCGEVRVGEVPAAIVVPEVQGAFPEQGLSLGRWPQGWNLVFPAVFD